ncbi:MAG: TIM-barrel domain-containing protein [Sphingomonas sp.]|jgi:alpha-glucosidase
MPRKTLACLLLLSASALPMPALAAPAPAPETSASPAVTPLADGAEVRGPIGLRVTALSDTTLRVRIARDGKFPEDASWAVPADIRHRSVAVHATPDGFSTGAMTVRIDAATLRLTVTDPAGKVIVADAADPVKIDDTGFTLRKAMPITEHYFGMGDKTGVLDRRGNSFVNWNTDAYGFSSSTDPLYKSIPFFIGVGGAGGSYGLFLDNSWRSWVDFGHREADTLAMGAVDGPIDYYLIAGPSTAEVVRRYTDLTGKQPLMPRWAFGYQQSRWSYMSDAEVREIARHMRADRVPLDVIWLDIDYQDRNRPFTTDAKTFPDLKKLSGDLKRDGIQLVAIADLHVAAAANQGYKPYDTGMAGHHFLRKADGSTYVGSVWPGAAVFPDFTDASARAWWGTQFAGLIDDGIVGIWNDMNEPAIFETPTKTMPLDNIHRVASDDYASRDATQAEIHNVYGMLNTRATYDGLRTLRPDERALVMTRATYAGGQRYAVTWTGDNSSSWDHLKLSIQQLLSLGLSGFAYSAADVGGFTGGPSPDLLTRWFEYAAFTPIFRDHSQKDAPRAEPWVDGPEHLAIRRTYVEERYRLLPYFYGLADLNARTGDPIMRPVFYDYPEALASGCDQSMTFTLGGNLLIAGAPKPESPRRYDICLPSGGWFDYWSGLPVTTAKPTETPTLDRLPVFVRAGTILPRQPVTQSTAQTPQGPLSLDIYPGPDCTGTLYLDDGHTVNGPALRQTVRCEQTKNGLTIAFDRREGSYQPWWREIAVTVHGWDGDAAVSAGAPVATMRDAARRTIRFTLPDQPGAARISIRK